MARGGVAVFNEDVAHHLTYLSMFAVIARMTGDFVGISMCVGHFHRILRQKTYASKKDTILKFLQRLLELFKFTLPPVISSHRRQRRQKNVTWLLMTLLSCYQSHLLPVAE